MCMGDTCCEKLSRVLLIIVNIIFFLAGGLMLAFGITAMANPSLLAKAFSYVFPSDTAFWLTAIMESNGIFMIIVGGCALIIALFGWIGACCNDDCRPMLILYAIVLIILLLAEVALIIYAAVYTESFKGTAESAMKYSLNRHTTDIMVASDGTVNIPTGADDLAWVAVQKAEQCCGVVNYADYQSYSWNNTGMYPGQLAPAKIPLSCCSNIDWNSPGTSATYLKLTACTQLTDGTYYSTGCSSAIGALVYNYKVIAIGIAAGTIGLAIILIILAFVLICGSSKQ